MQGISMAIVLLRVEMGIAYEVDNITSITGISFAASESSNDTTLP